MANSQQDKEFQSIYDNAHAVGLKAGQECIPTPMIVGTPTTLLGTDIDLAKKIYKIDGGVCGFAWVHIAGNTAFGRWAKNKGLASKDYPNGLCFWVKDFGQSMTRKQAYAAEFSKVLNDNKIKAYSDSRMD